MLARAVRLRCPACGKGALFHRYFCRTETCDSCRWRFERGEGHWVGGSEVHMILSYVVSVVICIPLLIVLGRTPAAMAGVIALHVALSLVAFRYSRSFFLAVDYYIDPGAPPPRDDDDDGEPIIRPRTPPTFGRRVRPVEAASGRGKPARLCSKTRRGTKTERGQA